jgi:hypothetical protein
MLKLVSIAHDLGYVRMGFRLLEDISHQHLRILHDGIHPISIETGVAFVQLECYHPFLRAYIGYVNQYRFFTETMDMQDSAISQYTIHVNPVRWPQNQSYFASKAPYVPLSYIARYLAARGEDGWRQDLLNFGLVCKGWSSHLDMFFSAYAGQSLVDSTLVEPYHTKPAACSIVRSLQWRPQRALLMQTLSVRFFSSTPTLTDSDNYFLEDFLNLLSLATAVKHVEIELVPLSLHAKLLSTLQKLASLEYFSVSVETALVISRRNFYVVDLLEVSRGWPKLREIHAIVGILDMQYALQYDSEVLKR